MAFQLLSKCYLDILMVPLFQHLWVIVPCLPCYLLFWFEQSTYYYHYYYCCYHLKLTHLYSVAINFLMFSNKYHYILLNYCRHYYTYIMSTIYLGVFYFIYAISKWSASFKYYFFILLSGAAAVPVLGLL